MTAAKQTKQQQNVPVIIFDDANKLIIPFKLKPYAR